MLGNLTLNRQKILRKLQHSLKKVKNTDIKRETKNVDMCDRYSKTNIKILSPTVTF